MIFLTLKFKNQGPDPTHVDKTSRQHSTMDVGCINCWNSCWFVCSQCLDSAVLLKEKVENP